MALEKRGARCVDSLGRIVVPKNLRDEVGFGIGEYVEFFLDKEQNSVIMKKYTNACTLCGSNGELVELDGKYLCKSCVDKISSLG